MAEWEALPKRERTRRRVVDESYEEIDVKENSRTIPKHQKVIEEAIFNRWFCFKFVSG